MEDKKYTFTKRTKAVVAAVLAVIVLLLSTVIAIDIAEYNFKRTWWYKGECKLVFKLPDCMVERVEGGGFVSVPEQISSADLITTDGGGFGSPSETAEQKGGIYWCPPNAFSKISLEISVDGKLLYKGNPHCDKNQSSEKGIVRAGKIIPLENGGIDVEYLLYYEDNLEGWQFFRKIAFRIVNYSDNL